MYYTQHINSLTLLKCTTNVFYPLVNGMFSSMHVLYTPFLMKTYHNKQWRLCHSLSNISIIWQSETKVRISRQAEFINTF